MQPLFKDLYRNSSRKSTPKRIRLGIQEPQSEQKSALLETVGTVDDFIRAVERVPGMEWLAEVEDEEIPPDDDFFCLG